MRQITVGQLPPDYRRVELESLPDTWKVVKLEEIFTPIPRRERSKPLVGHVSYKLITVHLYAKGITLRTIKNGDTIGANKLFLIKKGDFVFSKIDARNGAWGFVPDNLDGAYVSGDFPLLRLRKQFADQGFITFTLSQPHIWESLQNIAIGTTNRRRIQTTTLLSYVRIPLPPLPEQRAIAHVLRTIQRARETTEQVIAALRELKKSLMEHLFTYGPVPVEEAHCVEMRESPIGPIPAHWQVVRLGEVAETTSGGTPTRKERHNFGGRIPWVKSGELNDSFIKKTQETLSKRGLQTSNAKILPSGTLLIAMYGATAGKVGILNIDAATNQAVCAITPRHQQRFLTHYLFYVFIHQRRALQAERYGGAQPNLNQRTIQKFPIPLPPLPEQQKIARILQAVDGKIEAEEQRKEALETLFQTLLHELMSARRRLPAEFVARFAESREESL